MFTCVILLLINTLQFERFVVKTKHTPYSGIYYILNSSAYKPYCLKRFIFNNMYFYLELIILQAVYCILNYVCNT